ncbi:MAG: response regulator [Nitrospirota bacterium]
MIVSCGQCNVRLKIDETKIKEGGSRLKCPKCGNIFLVEKPAPAPAPEPPAPPVETPAPPVQERPAPPRPEPPAPPEPSWPPFQEPPAPKPPEPVFTPPPPSPAPPVEAPAPEAPPEAPVEAPPQTKSAQAGPKWKLDRSKIVVAHDGDSVLKLVESILTEEGYQVICESEGIATVVAIEREKPFLVLLDVALPRIYGFEICDRLKNSPESNEIKVILLAAIYDKTRYKREPVSLYGADDYIEKHHIQDCIAKKVKRLAADGQLVPGMNFPREEEITKPAPEDHPLREEQGFEMRKEEIKPVQATSSVGSQQVEAARRFARIILSDIALYNQGAVETGVRDGNFEEALAAELKEGRDLYNGRISQEVIASGDYFAEEISKFVDKKRQTMGLGI